MVLLEACINGEAVDAALAREVRCASRCVSFPLRRCITAEPGACFDWRVRPRCERHACPMRSTCHTRCRPAARSVPRSTRRREAPPGAHSTLARVCARLRTCLPAAPPARASARASSVSGAHAWPHRVRHLLNDPFLRDSVAPVASLTPVAAAADAPPPGRHGPSSLGRSDTLARSGPNSLFMRSSVLQSEPSGASAVRMNFIRCRCATRA